MASKTWREPRDAPAWLQSLSTDGTKWVIRDLLGRKGPIALDLDLRFPDGTTFADSAYAPVMEIAQNYVTLIRVHMPWLSSQAHAGRVFGMLVFLYWLNLKKVRRLHEVTEDHLTLYVEQLQYGAEWATEAPHRVLAYMRDLVDKGQSPPLAPRYKSRLHHTAIYEAARADWPRGPVRYKAAVVVWFEKNGSPDRVPDLPTVLGEVGVEPRRITKQALHRLLTPIEELWQWRRHLPSEDGFSFKPFPRGASAVARRFGVEPRRHRSPSPEFAFRYLNYAARWLTELGPLIGERDQTHDGQSRVGAVLKDLTFLTLRGGGVSVSFGRKGIGIEGVIRLFSSACFAVISALTARRLNEVLDLSSGCVQMDLDGDWWLTVYIEKTEQRYDRQPVPSLAVEAIRCMERVSAAARTSGNPSIWQWRRPDGSLRRLQPQNDLNVLARAGDLELEADDWRFTAHQFRRFFAVLFFWWYDKPDLPALSHHLRHTDIEMTRRYVTDVEFGRIWKETSEEFRADFLRDVVYGRRVITGPGGERLKSIVSRLISRFRRNVIVVPEEKALERLRRLVERWGAEFRQHVWGTICACPRSSSTAKLARCRGTARLGPVYENATESQCAVCPFAIHTDCFQDAAKEALHAALSRLAFAGDSILADVAGAEVQRLDMALRAGLPFPEFDDGTRE